MAIPIVAFLFLLSTQCSIADLPKGKEYKSDNSTDTIDWYRPVKFFIGVVLPNDFPIDFVADVAYDKFKPNVQEVLKRVVEVELGVLILFAFGALLTILIPLILFGCCCACCCCTTEAASPKAHKSRRCLTFLLILFLFITLPGALYIFISGNSLSKVNKKILERVNDTFDDASTFVGNTQLQINALTREKFNAMKNNIDEELFGINSTHFGRAIAKELEKEFGFESTIQEFQQLSKKAEQCRKAMAGVATLWKNATFIMTIDNVMRLKKEVDDRCSSVDSTCSSRLNSTLDALQLVQVTDVTIADIDVKKNFFDAEDQLVAALERIKLEAEKDKKKVDMKDLQDRLNKETVDFRSLTDRFDSIQSVIDVYRSNATDKINEYDYIITGYVSKYSSYFSQGVTAYILIIWLLFCLGMFFGTIFHQKSNYPEDRTCGSNLGGWMLVTGVAFMLLTSSVFWLLSTVLFPIGANAQQFICKPLYDDQHNFRVIRKAMNTLSFNISGFMTQLNGADARDFDAIDVLLDCKNNTAIYMALQLDKFIDIEKTLKTVENQLKDVGDLSILKTHITIDASYLFPSSIDITAVRQAGSQFRRDYNVEQAITKNLNVQSKVSSLIKELKEMNYDSNQLNVTKNSMEEIASTINDALEKWHRFEELNVTQNQFENLAKALEDIKSKISPGKLNNEVLQKAVENYSNQLFGHVRNYIQYASYAVKHEIGGCKPVWNLFESVRKLTCKEILDPLNGFWFALGWCLFFFLPLSIVSCKLSKHFRRLHNRSNRIYDSWNGEEFTK